MSAVEKELLGLRERWRECQRTLQELRASRDEADPLEFSATEAMLLVEIEDIDAAIWWLGNARGAR